MENKINFRGYLLEKIKISRMCEYTVEYSDGAKAIGNSEEILDSQTHSKMSEFDFKDIYKTKETLIKWYFGYLSNMKKMGAVGELGQIIKDKNICNVLSLGAGPCVLEYIVKTISRGGGENYCHGL